MRSTLLGDKTAWCFALGAVALAAFLLLAWRNTLLVLSAGVLLQFGLLLALYFVMSRDIAERKRTETELRERAAHAAFGAAVGAALTKADTLPKALQLCAEAMVRQLGAAMASIWTLTGEGDFLELRASASASRPLFGPEGRISVGEFHIGQIARDRRPALRDLTAGPEKDDKDWARRAGMSAFAGYPLIVEDRLVGVLAMFATRMMTSAALDALASVADEIALGIDRARAAEALRAIEKLKKEFVSTVSHELRTPLTSIRGSLGLLAAGVLGPLPPEAAEVIAVAERNVVRLVNLTDDILDLERLDRARMEMHFADVTLSSIFSRSLEAVRSYADQEGVLLDAEAPEAEVRADADRIVQVLVNLLSNAVKFSSRGSAVQLTCVEEGDRVEVRVRDRGRGVPADCREAIFERFRQVEASDARRKGGSGLGLAICKAIIEQHGGSIGVESEEGRGSVFWFRLPPAAAGQPGKPGPGAETEAGIFGATSPSAGVSRPA